MKKVLIILLLMVIALSGCASPFIQEENAEQTFLSANKLDSSFNYPKPLTLEEVKTTIIAEGLQLSGNQGETPNDYVINNVTPTIYTINQNNILMIYIYESIALRKEVCEFGGMGYYDSSKLPQKENWLTIAYTAKNALIIDMCNIENYQSNTTAFVQVLNSNRAAADSLNGVKEMVFADKGSCWDARYTVKYFQYWYKDNTGKIGIDQYSKGQWLVKYLGSDPESIHDLKYEYTHLAGGGSGNINGPGILHKIGKDYYLRLSYSEGRSIPNKDDVYTLTIQCEGKKDTLHLKMISDTNRYSLPIVSMYFLKQQGFMK